MKTLIQFAFLLCFSSAYAFESTVSISLSELKKSETVVLGSGGSDDQMLASGARVLQLQLLESNCERVNVIPMSMAAAEQNEFSVSSENCVVKEKKSATCESGYVARNLSANPNSPKDPIIGASKYKVCVKDNSKDSKKAESAKEAIQ